MKNRISILTAVVCMGLMTSCGDEFLQTTPLGVGNEQSLSNKNGVNAVLIGAYSLLDGVGAGPVNTSSVSNWIYGSVASDDAYKGSDVGDQAQITTIERYIPQADIGAYNDKWVAVYDGVSRSNNTIKLIGLATDMTEAEKAQALGEARFLRAWYHFEAKKLWNMVPYVDETVTDYNNLPNDKDIWPNIEADLQFAIDNVSATKAQAGRASKWAAKATLAKVHMYQQDYTAAKPLLDDVVNNGPFALVNSFHDNFRITTENNSESIFEVQMSVGDGGNGQNGSWGDNYNFPYGSAPGGCCGFYQPSQNLVNAFKTDAAGLPLLDTFNDVDVANDEGLSSTDAFTPYAGTLDPRLDWTVGRRGLPFLNWGVHPGKNWIRDQTFGGPYTFKKFFAYSGENAGAESPRANANNYRAIRYADILLMRAEVAVEENDLATALKLVNQVRTRAANVVVMDASGKPAANYLVKPYTAFANKDYARKAVRFERRVELAMEGHRHFDLVRWGVADVVLNAYLTKESKKRTYLNGATFVKGKSEYFPIPQAQIDIMGSNVLKQNP
ncbi:RagB/SusD family nutrient uptake outer membrane protein [Dyadobacter fanqingshengii]|uniref:RagB/SusD family nutrient uptake outer membrane protein n=1 Tax=Dyadobacter fanqingshengii TaxID=2906443 RepID=A0A9X1PCK9_9BACT|nr:RagB/SusD family nutrient uptake outer membrane protein [Dyadobacter fanqingshengii]MCF0042751.1 RagB/SusD family nutrient uptake outer membrane protein [Dyadobacter fanqingshengii]MCF2504478.1 RagB/SusD family nutrient uptake outer membrane protein [Dyadobacter fanqingshengii]USJ36027.1 RagB/SusD family nutrient uptake outer membrane protein [Dyadobacter fanqingshengii]